MGRWWVCTNGGGAWPLCVRSWDGEVVGVYRWRRGLAYSVCVPGDGEVVGVYRWRRGLAYSV